MTAATASQMFSAASLRDAVSAARVEVRNAQIARDSAVSALATFSEEDAVYVVFARIAEQAAERVIDALDALYRAEQRLDRWV